MGMGDAVCEPLAKPNARGREKEFRRKVLP
jgi:hypothetical protein